MHWEATNNGSGSCIPNIQGEDPKWVPGSWLGLKNPTAENIWGVNWENWRILSCFSVLQTSKVPVKKNEHHETKTRQ